MDGQPGQDDGEGAGQNRDPEPTPPPSGSPAPAPAGPDPRLAQFARDDARDAPAPSGPMALLADELSGPQRRCPGATGDELVGLLRAWAAIESLAAAAKLGVIREIMRRESPPSPGSDHGDLPETWSRSLRYELSGALACSTQSADSAASLAWQLGARLPRTGARLEDGTLTSPKARAVAETLEQLTDPDAAAAEALIADQLRLFAVHGVTLEVLYPKKSGGPDELLEDFVSLVTTFAGRLYGMRSAEAWRRLLAEAARAAGGEPGT